MQSEACFRVFNAEAWDAFVKIPKRSRKQREEFPREDFKKAPWQEMIDSGSYKLETTKQGHSFRRKFRLPASMFDWIVATALHRQLFPEFHMDGSASDARPSTTQMLTMPLLARSLMT